jgi:hypothetical protein
VISPKESPQTGGMLPVLPVPVVAEPVSEEYATIACEKGAIICKGLVEELITRVCPFRMGTVVRPPKVTDVPVGTVKGVLGLKNNVTVSPITTPVAAAVPPPPVKTRAGAEVYPDPGEVIVMELIFPEPEIVQVATAPDPPPPETVITGAVEYPVPPISPVNPLTCPEI